MMMLILAVMMRVVSMISMAMVIVIRIYFSCNDSDSNDRCDCIIILEDSSDD